MSKGDVLLVLKKDYEWGGYQNRVYINGKFEEGPTDFPNHLEDAQNSIVVTYNFYKDKGYDVKVSKNRYTKDLDVEFK